jgi:hypothetical protein
MNDLDGADNYNQFINAITPANKRAGTPRPTLTTITYSNPPPLVTMWRGGFPGPTTGASPEFNYNARDSKGGDDKHDHILQGTPVDGVDSKVVQRQLLPDAGNTTMLSLDARQQHMNQLHSEVHSSTQPAASTTTHAPPLRREHVQGDEVRTVEMQSNDDMVESLLRKLVPTLSTMIDEKIQTSLHPRKTMTNLYDSKGGVVLFTPTRPFMHRGETRHVPDSPP